MTVLINRGQLWSVECFWVKIGAIERDLMVSVADVDQEEELDEAAFSHLQEVLGLQALVLKREFNHPDIYWESNAVVHKQSGRCIEDSFLAQSMHGTARNGPLLD